RALTIDPLSGIINANYGYALMVARKFDEARAQLRKTLEMDPTFEVALRRSADLEAYLGNYEAARQIYARTSLPALKQLNLATPKENYYRARIQIGSGGSGFDIARAYAELGESDFAFQVLERCLKSGPGDFVYWIRSPEFDSLRSDARYAALMKRVNLP